MQSEGSMKGEIFLQTLQKDLSGNKDPEERRGQCPSSQGGKAGRALRGSSAVPLPWHEDQPCTLQAIGCSALHKKI